MCCSNAHMKCYFMLNGLHISYLVVPEEISEVSEFSLFLSWTMLKSANFEKSVFPCPTSLADFRDSISLTSSNFFLTSGPPFWKIIDR